jgi:hypothetical protein
MFRVEVVAAKTSTLAAGSESLRQATVVAAGMLTVLEAVIVTSSEATGMTPPVHVPVTFQAPPPAAEEIAAI